MSEGMEGIRKVINEVVAASESNTIKHVDSLKEFIKSQMVCIPHCDENHKNLELKLLELAKTLENEIKMRNHDYVNIRRFVYAVTIFIMGAQVVIAYLRGYLDAIYTAIPNMQLLTEKLPDILKLLENM